MVFSVYVWYDGEQRSTDFWRLFVSLYITQVLPIILPLK